MTSFSLLAFCTTPKKLNTLMANLLLMWYLPYSLSEGCLEVCVNVNVWCVKPV